MRLSRHSTGGVNGVGGVVVYTLDGGQTFNGTKLPSALGLSMGIASDGDDIFTVGFPSSAYSHDRGATVSETPPSPTTNPLLSQAAASDSGAFYVTGMLLGGRNGVSRSTDGGETFESFVIDKDSISTIARYGSFVGDTWYVTGGTWPADEDVNKDKSERMLTKRFTAEGHYKPQMKRGDGDDDGADSTFVAEIAKSTDGGKTWSNVFEDVGNFYFNGIDCLDSMTCVAVGESDADSPDPGSRVWSTTDGGQTWVENFKTSDPQESLFTAKFVSKDEIWAVGGNVSNRQFLGRVWSSTDWAEKGEDSSWADVGGIDNAWLTDIGMAGEDGDAFAVALTIQSTASVFKYTAA